MELQIGSKIKKLRRQRNLTQEEVAAHLGISFQAISKWERGDGYPDITILPALAAYFEISIDDLLGMNELAAQKEYSDINRAWSENNAAGRHAENTALMRNALKTYPNDALLLVQLSASLEKLNGTDYEKLANLRESAAVQEQILRYGKDSEIRNATQFNICFTYQKLGENEKAIEQAKKLPNLYKARENALVLLQDGEEKSQIAKAALAPLKWSLMLHLKTLADSNDHAAYRKLADQICQSLTEIEQSA